MRRPIEGAPKRAVTSGSKSGTRAPAGPRAAPRIVGWLGALTAGLVLLGAIPSCGETGTPGLRPGKLDPATPPVTFTQPTAQVLSGAALGQSTFRFTVENASHCDISAVKFAAVLFDGNGARIGGGPQDVGLAGGAGDIHPGETYECTFTTGDDKASRAVVVLKEVIYVFVPEGESNAMFRVPMKWTNPGFETGLAAAAPR